MKIMIIGGGNVGYYLIKTLAAEKHNIMLVETDLVRCERIAAEFNTRRVEVTHGDGTDVEVLRDAGIYRTDAFIAVSGHDQDNFVACQLAKDYFGVKLTISRVNNPKNIRVFEELGVDSVISSTARIAGIINQELDWNDVNQLLKDKTGDVRIREATVEANSNFDGKMLSELGLPKGMIIVSVIRGDKAYIPNGETRIEAYDSVIIMGNEPDFSNVLHSFSSK